MGEQCMRTQATCLHISDCIIEPGFDGIAELQNHNEGGYLELLPCTLPAALDSVGVEE